MAAAVVEVKYNIMNTPVWKSYFEFQGEDVCSDHFAIQITKSTAIQFLQQPSATKEQVVGLSFALFALQRLPKSTPGVDVIFGIVQQGKTKYPDGTYFSEMYYLDFHISDTLFQITRGGSVNMGAGSDSYSLPGWHIETNGFREAACDLVQLQNEVNEIIGYLDDNAIIRVEDNTEFDLYRLEFG